MARLFGAARGTLGVLGIAGVLTLSAQTTSPAKMLAESLAAGRAQSSVAWGSDWLASSGVEAIEATQAGRHSGVQQIAVTADKSTGVVTVELVGKTAYMKGDTMALEEVMGFKVAAATHEANRWLSLTRTNSNFSNVSGGLTVSSAISQLELSGKLAAKPRTTLSGEAVDGISGMAKPQSGEPATKAVLYVQAGGKHLPVGETQTNSDGTGGIALKKWGERVDVKAPASATPELNSWLS